jgi:hypothetical protein
MLTAHPDIQETELHMYKTTSPSPLTAEQRDAPELFLPGFAGDSRFGVGGVLAGETCLNGTLLEVYLDFGPDGTIVGRHTVPIGSC